LDPESGTLVFRSEQVGTVTPGRENGALTLTKIPEAQADFGQKLEVRLIDVDS
jgi:hypothetical protein